MSSYQNYCMSPFRWNIEKNNRFYMLQDNKCVLNCLYFYIRTYTDVFYMYCISFRFNVYVYISIPIYVLSWLWILVLIAVFFVSNLMYCFFMLCQKWRNKQVIYISVINDMRKVRCIILIDRAQSLKEGTTVIYIHKGNEIHRIFWGVKRIWYRSRKLMIYSRTQLQARNFRNNYSSVHYQFDDQLSAIIA